MALRRFTARACKLHAPRSTFDQVCEILRAGRSKRLASKRLATIERMPPDVPALKLPAGGSAPPEVPPLQGLSDAVTDAAVDGSPRAYGDAYSARAAPPAHLHHQSTPRNAVAGTANARAPRAAAGPGRDRAALVRLKNEYDFFTRTLGGAGRSARAASKRGQTWHTRVAAADVRAVGARCGAARRQRNRTGHCGMHCPTAVSMGASRPPCSSRQTAAP